jgi:RNA:NAD 2'-phosphotransferase (TPT1/KptA family)
MIQEIVDTNDKKRYELTQKISPETEEKEWYIRATQGHSMDVVES